MYEYHFDVLAQQGQMIDKADEKFKGEDWQFPRVLRQAHDEAYIELMEAQKKYEKAFSKKLSAYKEVNENDKEVVHLISQLENYIGFSIQKNESKDSDHDKILKSIEILPDDEEEVLEVLRNHAIPRLDKWDGTEHEIPLSLKQDIRSHAEDYARAIDVERQQDSYLDEVRIELEKKKNKYIRQLSIVRSWLYNNLPNWRYDERLGYYGFRSFSEHDNPIPSSISKISIHQMTRGSAKIEWSRSKNSRRYELFRSKDDGEFVKIYEFDHQYFIDKSLAPGHNYKYKARGISRWSKGKFSDIVSIDVK